MNYKALNRVCHSYSNFLSLNPSENSREKLSKYIQQALRYTKNLYYIHLNRMSRSY